MNKFSLGFLLKSFEPLLQPLMMMEISLLRPAKSIIHSQTTLIRLLIFRYVAMGKKGICPVFVIIISNKKSR